MAQTLFGKNSDLDDIDFMEAIEAAFDVRFDNSEPPTWTTFGDVFDATCRRVQAVERGPAPCLSATAYRRIRKAILKDRPDLKVRPETPLATLLGNRTGPAWCRALQRDLELRLPDRPFRSGGVPLFFVISIGTMMVAGWNGLGAWIGIPSGIALGTLAVMWLRPALPVRTVGELARALAALNPQALSPGGTIRTRDVWDSLVRIARDVTLFDDPIERETVLIG